MKKTMLMLLIMLMSLPALARDFSYEYEGQTLVYTVLSEDSKTVKTKDGKTEAGNKVSGVLTIPSTIYDDEIPYTVVEIGEYAFRVCKELTEVSIPNSVKTICKSAFLGCTGLSSISLGDSVQHINEYAFSNCSNLKNVRLPNSIQTIGHYAFFKCSGLTEIIIPSSVQNISSETFDGCIGLIKSAYPQTLYNPFKNGFAIAYNPAGVIIEDGWIYGPGKTEIFFAPQTVEGEFMIHESVHSIGKGTFYQCNGLTSINIPSTVESIGDYAFYNCCGLTELIIPDLVNNIGNYAFYGCSELTSIKLPTTVESIGDYAFYGCNTFTSVIIPNQVKTIGRYAFYGCNSLLKSAYPNNLSNPFSIGTTVAYKPNGAIIEDGWIYGSEKTEILFAPYTLSGELDIPDSVHSIGQSAFERCTGLTSITIPKSVSAIERNAFSGCHGLTTVNVQWEIPIVIDNSVFSLSSLNSAVLYIPEGTAIAYVNTEWWSFKNRDAGGIRIKDYTDDVYNYALIENFDDPQAILISGNYSSLINADIPERITDLSNEANPVRYYVTAIGPEAFKNCKDLSSVNFNSRSAIHEIGMSAFEGCTGLEKANFASIDALCRIKFDNVTANPLWYAGHLYINNEEITEIVIPAGVKNLYCTFAGGRFINTVDIPNSVNNIDFCTFYNCSNLNEIIIPNSVKTIGPYAFYECSGLLEITIPKSVEDIGFMAFNRCYSLNEVKFEDGTSEINLANYSFDRSSISSIYLGRETTNMPIDKETVKSVTIGNLIERISDNLFKDCSNLSSLSLGANITEIGQEAFSGCCALTDVVLPPYVKTIGASAFANNSNLSSIIMGHSVVTIGEKAYDGCPAATVSITTQTPPTAPNNTFSSYTGKLYLQGSGAMEAYYDAYTCWDRFDSYVIIEATKLISEGEMSLTGKPGDKFQLTASVTPENATLPYVFWKSTNPSVATVDNFGLVTIQDGDDSECQIIAETLNANGPQCVFALHRESSGIEDVTLDRAVTNHIDYSAPYMVYNLHGALVGESIYGIEPGLYIVRQGATVQKIAIR